VALGDFVDAAARSRGAAHRPARAHRVNTSLSAYYNIVRPDDGPNWQVRAQVQLMFPK